MSPGAGSPATGLRESKKSGTRAALIECALELASERGYHGFTISELVERVGVSRRTFSNYFAGKAECLAAVNDRWMDAALELEETMPVTAPITDILRTVLKNLADQIESAPAGFLAMATTEPELIGATNALDVTHAERVAAVISARTGIPADDLRLPLLADFSLAAGRACVSRWVGGGRQGGKAGLARNLDLAFSLIDFDRLVRSP
jgi:AcrR family transcriptional regulator